MKQNKKSFTLIEMLVVIAIIGILAGMLSGPLMKARRNAQLATCVNNLKQIGTALFQYSMPYTMPSGGGIPQFQEATDLEACTKNLMRIYVAGLADNLALFVCPVSNFSPTSTDSTHQTNEVNDQTQCSLYTAYNMTTKYNPSGDSSNKIIIADMPFYNEESGVSESASVHDSEANKITDGPNCLFQDNHVANIKTLCPSGSSVYDYDDSHNNGIYKTANKDKGGKLTCILGLKR